MCRYEGKEVDMEKEKRSNHIVKTTVYFPRVLYNSLKLMTVLTGSSMSKIIRGAVREKLEELKKKQ